MKAWHGLVLDGVIIICMTVLVALKVADMEVFLAVIGPLAGARAMQRLGGGKGPPSGGATGAGVAAGSAALALLVVGSSLLSGRPHA